MFDLDERIRQWRETMLAAMPGQSKAVDELESHLRDEIQRLGRAGHAADEAFETALARLGDCQQLAAEFRKVPALGPLTWLPARVLLGAGALLGLSLAAMLVRELWLGKANALLAGHVFAVTLGYSTAFAVGAMAVWSVLDRAFRGWDETRGEALRSTMRVWTMAGLALTVVGVVLGAFWARGHMGRFWGWDLKETTALAVLIWNVLVLILLSSAPMNRRLADPRWNMLLGLAGNVVIALCWFGPALLNVGLHAYGFPSWRPLVGFTAVQGLLLLLTLVRPGQFSRPSGQRTPL